MVDPRSLDCGSDEGCEVSGRRFWVPVLHEVRFICSGNRQSAHTTDFRHDQCIAIIDTILPEHFGRRGGLQQVVTVISSAATSSRSRCMRKRVARIRWTGPDSGIAPDQLAKRFDCLEGVHSGQGVPVY